MDSGLAKSLRYVVFIIHFLGIGGDRVATCDLVVNSALAESQQQSLSGTITFTQQIPGSDVTVDLDISGFSSTDAEVKHGFHVHTTSDFTRGCNSAGGHFNPHHVNHGAPSADIRHVGDLGNILEDANGEVKFSFNDDVIDLDPQSVNSIVGRSIVIHAGEDDLGSGTDAASLATGNAGSRLACCTITEQETTPPGNGGGKTSPTPGYTTTLSAVLLLVHVLTTLN